MDKCEKFAILDQLQLSRAEIEEYLALCEKKGKACGEKINTELPIVYRNAEGTCEVFPYLDTARLAEVWGIEADGVFWKKTCDYRGMLWPEVKKGLLFYLKGDIRYVPEVVDYKKVFAVYALFNRTTKLLREHDVAADDWDGEWYWALKEKSEFPDISLFEMGNGIDFDAQFHMNYVASLRIVLPK